MLFKEVVLFGRGGGRWFFKK